MRNVHPNPLRQLGAAEVVATSPVDVSTNVPRNVASVWITNGVIVTTMVTKVKEMVAAVLEVVISAVATKTVMVDDVSKELG